MNMNDTDNTTVEAYSTRTEHFDASAGLGMGLSYDDAEDAADDANDLLTEMGLGGIHTIDTTDSEFSGAIVWDHQIGNVHYWILYDEFIEIWLLDNGLVNNEPDIEIIFYYFYDYIEGTSTKQEIETNAPTIANQFATLPTPRVGPETEYITNMEEIEIDDDGDLTYRNLSYWTVFYNRTYDDILCSDFIKLMFYPNGDLHLYMKVWFMDLSSFSTTYDVTQTEAEDTATDYPGTGSTDRDCNKKIVRPGYEWEVIGHTTPEYGNNPMIVWEVYVEDADENLCIFYVDGVNDDAIVGGGYIPFYYTSEGVGG